MNIRKVFSAAATCGVVAIMLPLSVLAQTQTARTLAEPQYGSGASTGAISNSNFNSPESDGRPGVKFYEEGMAAYHHKDYRHAVYMLKLAASLAYKPAEYNLGVMYFQGEGVAVDRPLGTAWMFLAAERNTPDYVYARHMMVESLDYNGRSKALELLQQMRPKYGDKVALQRAKAQWAFAKHNETGTHVGGTVGELHVGIRTAGGAFHTPEVVGGPAPKMHGWTSILGAQAMDGSIAYHQFRQSDNPYSSVFLKNRSGTVTVEPLQKPVPHKKQGTAGQSVPPASPSHNR